jgi:hypothetical protein
MRAAQYPLGQPGAPLDGESSFVAIVDLLPVIGSAIVGVVVCLVALSVSVPVCLAAIDFSSLRQTCLWRGGLPVSGSVDLPITAGCAFNEYRRNLQPRNVPLWH